MTLFNVDEMAEALDVSDSYIRRILREGKIKGAFKTGRSWKVSEPDWIAYLKSINYPVDKLKRS